MEQKTLLEYLTGQFEQERVLAVSDLLYQSESYMRAVAQAIRGLAMGVADNEQAYRDAVSIIRMADEVTAWMYTHQQTLCRHVEAQAVPVEPKDGAHTVTLH